MYIHKRNTWGNCLTDIKNIAGYRMQNTTLSEFQTNQTKDVQFPFYFIRC